MDILVTLPPNMAQYIRKHHEDFPEITTVFSDPDGRKLGSGGGTVNVLWQHGIYPGDKDLLLTGNGVCTKRMVIHSDGESRRLAAYAPGGKSLMPFPVFRWGRGQRIDQTLLSLQIPLFQKILGLTPQSLNTLIASGDAMVWMENTSFEIPQADVVCFGAWAPAEIAARHGVFICPRSNPGRLHRMLQKPDAETLQALSDEYLFLLDAGIWLLSDRAVNHLFKASGWNGKLQAFTNELPDYYDLYGEFGPSLGTGEKNAGALSVAVVPMKQAEFYHFGSTSDLLHSTTRLQNRITDQRDIWHKKVRPHPDIFVQNSKCDVRFTSEVSTVWIENSHIPASWKLHTRHVLTGIPENSWQIDLPAGICLDIVPVDRDGWCLRPYGFDDLFRGNIANPATCWQNQPVDGWFRGRNIPISDLQPGDTDIYDTALFPVLTQHEMTEDFIRWMVIRPGESGSLSDLSPNREKWLKARKLSSRDLITRINHQRLITMRKSLMQFSLEKLAGNYRKSIFYQLDLKAVSKEFQLAGIPLPAPPSAATEIMPGIHHLMFAARVLEHSDSKRAEISRKGAFELLRNGMLDHLRETSVTPFLNIKRDQIIWARSPVRLDLSGGWTDTPPYCLLNGGRVVNLAVELNGQPPIQVYIRPTSKPVIIIHSIDLGLSETITSFDEIEAAGQLGSAFSIPRAALMMAGFHPTYSGTSYKNLKAQLDDFGGGFEISLVVAVPKGSGLGTSSILAAAILGALSDFCSLGWDRYEIANRTLLVEQLLTTGGGWQDQFGGVFEGIKLIESMPGLVQNPSVKWMPEHLFMNPDKHSLMLLYYTGITRQAKDILAEIVQGMFLNSSTHLSILAEMKYHASHTAECIGRNDWNEVANAIKTSWELNKRLDSGTNPPAIEAILQQISDLIISAKLLGAGGGGYLLMMAKDEMAALRIKQYLTGSPPNPGARFVDWKLSHAGLEVTKS